MCCPIKHCIERSEEMSYGLEYNKSWLAKMMPEVDTKLINEICSKVENNPTKIIITTTDKSESIFGYLKWLGSKYFDIVVLIAPGSNPEFIEKLKKHRITLTHYPMGCVGNLRKIRLWIENYFKPPFAISDDDPGNSFGNKPYKQGFPRIVIPNDDIGCGAHRFRINQEFFNWLINVTIYCAKICDCAYAGFNGSENSVSPLPEHPIKFGSSARSSFGTLGYVPFSFDVAVTGFQIVLRPCREHVPGELHNVKQEYSTSCATAIGKGLGGTFIFRNVLFTFAVNPPKDAEKDIEKLYYVFPDVVKEGNSAGGRSNEEKTGCIIKFKTMISSNNFNVVRHDFSKATA